MTPYQIDQERLRALDTMALQHGSHDSPSHGLCVMEAVAWVAGEPHSDRPQCASPVIAAMLRSWNDALCDEERDMLRPLVPRLVGTDATSEVEENRAWMAVDWMVREFLPAWLDLAKLTADAERVRALPEITGATSEAAMPEIHAVRKSANAARVAAGDAACKAAWAAARAADWTAYVAAAWGADWATAGRVAKAAAGVSAGDAAGSAAGAADGFLAGAVFKPTVQALQASALRLVERMIDSGEGIR